MLKPVLNTLFLPSWTALMVTCAGTGTVLLRDRELFRRMERVWARGILDFSDIDVSVRDDSGMREGQGYVVVSNHLSHLDIVVLFMTLPVVPGFVAKQELKKVPFLSQALDLGGHVLIDRQDRDRARESLAEAAGQIRSGRTVLVFPEGTRGGSNTIGVFKTGAFHLAKEAGVPLVPVGISGSRDVMPREGWLIHPGRIHVHIGEPIEAETVTTTPLRQLAKMTRRRVAELSGLPLRT
ncbi:MAG: lysophospholipid acyltransferase family protein [Myxococcales bacterium]|nr:lysophospholipid acyltransferase family protein [Myxococcales bacterium]